MSNLNGLNAGDFVAVMSTAGWGRGSIEKRCVQRTTPTRVVLENGAVFSRRGVMVGSGEWSRIRAEPWDDAAHASLMEEIRQERELHMARRKLADYAWKEVTAEQAASALALIESWAQAPQEQK